MVILWLWRTVVIICGNKETSALVPEHTLLSLFLCFCQLQPLFELRCSNNVVHLHTCADSCAALVNLLQYLVSQGDLHPPPRQTSPTEIAGQKLPVRQFSVYAFMQVALSSCNAELQLECVQMCEVYFMFLAVRKSCSCAALSSSWNCRDQPVWPDRCFNGHRKKPPRRVHWSRYFRVWLFTLNIHQTEVCSVASCCSWCLEVSLSQNNPELHHCMSDTIFVLWIFTSADM